MLQIDVQSSGVQTSEQVQPSLADLSRNASVISSSSESSSTSDLTVHTPVRPRPIRTFSSQRPLRSKSPQSPRTPRGSKPPAYLARELGVVEDPEDKPSDLRPPSSHRRVSKSRNSSVVGRLGAEDFDFGRVLGEGAYSTVMLARHKNTKQEYAIKVLDKGHLKRNNKLMTALAEKNTLVRLGAGHPGIVRLHWTFQDEWSLFFVLDLARNGELQTRISRMGSLSLDCARYYSAQLIDALDYMHNKGVIHRDLKPENLLLDDQFRLKLTDFGTGKILSSGAETSKTWVGTAQYIAPELLEISETSKSSDLWSLGCIVFQMISGRFAFQGLSEFLTWQKIKQLDYNFPDGFDEQAKDLVQKLLVRDPTQRLGAGSPGSDNDMSALRAHPFFANLNWNTLWTDPAPALEAGMVKKDTNVGSRQQWEEIGAAWDDEVDAVQRDEDEMSWASDGDEGRFMFAGGSGAESGASYEEELVGPLDEKRPPALLPSPAIQNEVVEVDSTSPRQSIQGSVNGTSSTAEIVPTNATQSKEASPAPIPTPIVSGAVRFAPAQSQLGDMKQEGRDSGDVGNDGDEDRDIVAPTLNDIPLSVRTQPIDVPKGARDSYSTSSATSSSDGSPPSSKLDSIMEAAELNRGRNRSQTPIQSNSQNDDEQWSSLLMVGESVIFNTTVETSALKRRASRLLAFAGGPTRKTRELVLTDRRLVCIKRKPRRPIQLSTELTLKPTEREKDAKTTVVGAESKSEREFVVMTGTKSYTFIAMSPSLATTWIRKIREALQTYGGAKAKATGQA